MAKKLRKGLGEDKRFIGRGNFEISTAKMYIVVLLIVFHIIPLLFAFMGTSGMKLLMNVFLYTINVIAIFGIGLLYGIKVGYNFKFPLIMTVISVLSFVFYYNDNTIFSTPVNYIQTGLITIIVYTVFSFLATLIGGALKKFF